MPNFRVFQRDTYHWDIYNDKHGLDYTRAFRIRGKPGDIYVHDERRDGRPFPRHPYQFGSVPQAMAWIATRLMTSESPELEPEPEPEPEPETPPMRKTTMFKVRTRDKGMHVVVDLFCKEAGTATWCNSGQLTMKKHEFTDFMVKLNPNEHEIRE